MYIQDLPKSDAVTLLEIINACTICHDIDSFKNSLAMMKKLISHDYALGELAKMETGQLVVPNLLVNVDFPWEYLVIYQKDMWRQTDPIQKDTIGHPGARYLADIFKKNNPPRYMHSTALDFKIKDGYVQAVWNKINQKGSLFYFFGQSVKQDKRTELILDLVVPHLHQALTRAINHNTYKRISLSLKEIEVLKWLKQGKSTWDVSVILGISERTVKFHVSNIMQKLDASSRTHAVAIAIEQGLVGIE